MEYSKSGLELTERFEGLKLTCRQCGRHLRSAGRIYCSGRCKWRAYYYRHSETSKDRRIRSQQKNAAFVDQFKSRCADCGNNDKRVLDFHHLNEKTKGVATLRVAGYSRDRIVKEIKKCIVLCANCHRIKHWDEQH